MSTTPQAGLDCGDGGPAPDARLSYPKGLAAGFRGELYLADGRRIRVVSPEGIIDSITKVPNYRWVGRVGRDKQKQWIYPRN